MIPWFVTRIVAAIAKPFGYQLYCRATVGRWGADAMHLVRRGELTSTTVEGDLAALAEGQAALLAAPRGLS